MQTDGMEKQQHPDETRSDSLNFSEGSRSENQTLRNVQNFQQKEHPAAPNAAPAKSSESSVVEKESRGSQTGQKGELRKEQEEEVNSEDRFLWDSLKNIEGIMREVEVLRRQIETFSGCSTDDRDYVYLEEMMMRATVALDKVETSGNLMLRQERKRAIQYIQKLMRIMDSKLKDNRSHIRLYRPNSDSDDDL